MSGRCVVEAISGGKISPVSRSKRKTQSFPHLRRSLDTRGLRVWREEGRLIAFVPSGTSLMKGAVAAQVSFLTLDQKSSKYFCKHPKIKLCRQRYLPCKSETLQAFNTCRRVQVCPQREHALSISEFPHRRKLSGVGVVFVIAWREKRSSPSLIPNISRRQVRSECITSVHSKNFPWISSFLSLDNCSSVSTSETRFSILFREDAWLLLQTDLDCNWLEAGGFAYPKIKLCRQRYLPCKSETLQAFNTCRRVQVCPQREHALSISEFPHRRKLSGVGVVFVIAWREKRSSPSLIPNISRRQVRSECITSVHSKNFPWISSFLSLDNCSSVSTSETRFSILFREDAWLLLQTDLDCNWLEAGGFAYPKIKLCRQRYLPCKSETLQAFNTCRRVQVCPQREHALSISEFPHRRKLSGVGVVFVIAWREKRSSPSLIPNISRRQVRSECITSVHSKNFPWISSFLRLDNCSSVSTSETRFSILFREDAWLLLQTDLDCNWLEAGGFAYPKIKLCRQRYLPCKSETLQAFNTCRRVQVCPQREHALSISEFPHRRKLSGVGVVFVIAWREKRSSPSLIPNISRRQVRSECITSVHSKNFPWISSFLSLDNCSSVSTSETRFSILFREDAWLLLQTDLDCNWLEAGGFAYPKIKLCRQRYLPCKSETLQAFNTCRRVQVCPQREHALSISEFPQPSQIIWSRCRVCDRLKGETKFAVTHSKY